MNTITHLSKNHLYYFRILHNVHKILQKNIKNFCSYTPAVDAFDMFTSELLQKQKKSMNSLDANISNIRYYAEFDNSNHDISQMSFEELNSTFLQLLAKNKDKEIVSLISICINLRKQIGEETMKKLFRTYSLAGKPEIITVLQKHCSKVNVNFYNRNGEFQHYLAKAQCLKGNSEKGLLILKDSYHKNINFRCFYRTVFKELIHDSVLNKSEASLVIFKKYVLEFSEKFGDHYPLICLWYICWSSTWFSDQSLSNELLERSEKLRDIVRDKSMAFSVTSLRNEYNDDAVVRLLQILLKYNMMTEYAKVLQVLFAFKLRNGDIRGCTEIIKNCEALGIVLPSSQQGRYIKMLINVKPTADPKQPSTKPDSKNFKLKF